MTEIQSRTYGTRTESSLVIAEVKREYDNSNISCEAVNNNITDPPSTSVTLLLYGEYFSNVSFSEEYTNVFVGMNKR